MIFILIIFLLFLIVVGIIGLIVLLGLTGLVGGWEGIKKLKNMKTNKRNYILANFFGFISILFGLVTGPIALFLGYRVDTEDLEDEFEHSVGRTLLLAVIIGMGMFVFWLGILLGIW